MLTFFEDNVLKQIRATHTPIGLEFDVRPLLHHVENILSRATQNPDGLITTGSQAHIGSLEEKTDQAGFLVMDEVQLLYTIDRISREISYKNLTDTDALQTSLSIFKRLAYFAWDAKLVITLAAFALHYGKFCLLAHISPTNQLAKSIALLSTVPGSIEQASELKPHFDALNDIIMAILKVIRHIVEFEELPPKYTTLEATVLSFAKDHVIPVAVYWTIKSIVVITSFTSNGYDLFKISTTDTWELPTLAHKLITIHEDLKKELEKCKEYIDDKKGEESFQMLSNLLSDNEKILASDLFEVKHSDNTEVLKALIDSEDDRRPLFDGSTKNTVNIDVLRRKNVLLLISGLDISQHELSILEQIYTQYRSQQKERGGIFRSFVDRALSFFDKSDHHYEVVWMPVVDRTIQRTNDHKQADFENLRSKMPWYTVLPSLIDKGVVKFMKEKWHFRNKPILVVLDSQGKVVSPNAIHMMWIWGSNAFPFTSLKEGKLWEGETWRLELLVDNIDPTILNWIKDGKYIFLYGGDNTEWVRKFTNSAHTVALVAGIPLEMVYVGKAKRGKAKQEVQRVINTNTVEKLGSLLLDQAKRGFFWTRLESMLFSMIQHGKADNLVIQEIEKLLSYDKEGQWAVLSKGSNVVVNGHGSTILTTLLEYDTWKENVSLCGFDMAFKNHYDLSHTIDGKQPCCVFNLSHAIGKIPERMRCPQCHCNMNKYTTFLCYHEEDVLGISS